MTAIASIIRVILIRHIFFSIYCDSSSVPVIGTAFALNMLFNIPIWIGVLLTGLSTLMLLALQQYGVTQYVPYVLLKDLWFPFLKYK